MNAKQIYEIVNGIASQSLGLTGLTATDVSFISVGKEVLSTDANKDAWYSALADRIGKVTYSNVREYKSKEAVGLLKEPFDYGIALQKLYVDLVDASENVTWDGQSTPASDPFKKNTLSVKQKIFSPFGTWEYGITIPDVQLKTAFTSAEEMGKFINGIMLSVRNALILSMENTAKLCRCRFIASKAKANRKQTYVNVLDMYNKLTGRNLTVATCQTDKEFLRYLALTIKLCSNYMENYSATFNEEGYKRFTAKENQRLNILSTMAENMAFYLESDTYHKELVSLKGYSTVDFWQGCGDGTVNANYSFADVSKVQVNLDGASDIVEVNGVVAVLYDSDAMGITIDRKRTKSIYNPKGEYTNYFFKAEVGYFNDLSENGIVFYIAEVQ